MVSIGLVTPISASPVAGIVTGGTVVTFVAPNIRYTQYAVSFRVLLRSYTYFFEKDQTCYFGTTVVKASYSKDLNQLNCISPLSPTVSPPLVALNLSVDGNPSTQVLSFYFYGKFPLNLFYTNYMYS